VLTCPSCGQENPEGFRLCGMCGVSLSPEPTTAREERTVVTVLFCDLVGFTARAEQLDPEEVRAVLRPCLDRVRSELEKALVFYRSVEATYYVGKAKKLLVQAQSESV